MLYVFQVDTGNMLTFDMNLALDSVSNLKEAIWTNCRIPQDRQVLLVSGGECLNPGNRVCMYAAGTDTNPIFLFNRNNIETSPTSSGQQPFGSNENLTEGDSVREQVDACLALPPTYNTIVSRAKLAQRLWDMAKDLTRRCEQYIHDQHLQHQGWAAVVANLEDFVSAFTSRLDAFAISFNSYMTTKMERDKILESYPNDLAILSKIVFIPSLVTGDGNSHRTCLLDWIKCHDSSSDLETLANSCIQAISKLDANAIETLDKEARGVVNKAGQTTMKEIKGLEERLYGLDQLLLEAKKLVHEQYDMAQAIAQNQMRATNLKDTTVLPDLCNSHHRQLIVMSKNHEQLDDIRRRCGKAKEELSANLNTRLKWVMFVQRALYDSSNRLTVFSENLKRLHSQVGIIKQIHVAKEIYCEAVVEVYRRRCFSDAYLTWANSVADKMDIIYKNEVSQRKVFAARFESHFVSRLFTGLEDYPSAFANERPLNFDTHLPKITIEDLKNLQTIFPSIIIKDETPDFSFDISATSRSINSETLLETETENLKAEIESLKLKISANDKELRNSESAYNLQVQCLKAELSEMQDDLECEKRLRAQLVESHEEVVVDLQDKLCQVEKRLLTTEQLLTTATHNIDVERASWLCEENKLREDYEKAFSELEMRLSQEKESELKEVKDKARGDVEGLRSRYRFMQSMEQKSPTENFDRSLESFEKLPKYEDLTGDLYRTIDMIHKSNPDGISPKLLRKIISKLNTHGNVGETSAGTPSLIRVRNISESGGGRHSFEIEDENTMRSVYGLDNSVIDAATAMSDNIDPGYKELGDMIIPSQRIVCVSSKLLHLDRISINSCKSGDYVFIYWNSSLQSYVIYLNTKNIHFLHTECLKSINHNDDHPVEGFIASVIEKEFCVARRAQNRYRVPQGFHFYRVRVKVMEILNIDLFLSS